MTCTSFECTCDMCVSNVIHVSSSFSPYSHRGYCVRKCIASRLSCVWNCPRRSVEKTKTFRTISFPTLYLILSQYSDIIVIFGCCVLVVSISSIHAMNNRSLFLLNFSHLWKINKFVFFSLFIFMFDIRWPFVDMMLPAVDTTYNLFETWMIVYFNNIFSRLRFLRRKKHILSAPFG